MPVMKIKGILIRAYSFPFAVGPLNGLVKRATPRQINLSTEEYSPLPENEMYFELEPRKKDE